jgi:hypothetical protein
MNTLFGMLLLLTSFLSLNVSAITAAQHSMAKISTLNTAVNVLKRQTKLPAITGYYRSKLIKGESGSCNLSVEIKELQGEYFYTFNLGGHIKKGKVKLTKIDEPDAAGIVFTGIKWAEYKGDISRLKDGDRPTVMKIPVGIEGVWTKSGITIQNYGNAMNYYVQIAGCEKKYIELIKQ